MRRQQQKRKNAFRPPTPGLFLFPRASQPLQSFTVSLSLSFFIYLLAGLWTALHHGHNPSHGPRVTGHADLPDTTSSTRRHATVTFCLPLFSFSFSPSWFVSRSFSLFHSFFLSLSFLPPRTHTTRTIEPGVDTSTGGSRGYGGPDRKQSP